MDEMNPRVVGALKLLGLLAFLSAGLLIVRETPLGGVVSREGVANLVGFLRESQVAPFVFVPIYAGAVTLGIPGTIPTLVGGAVFGLWWGTALNWLGATVGANLAYLLARFLGRDGITQLLGETARRWPGLETLDEAVQSHGFRGMLTLRLIPVVPFNALNFGGGLVGMSWPAYALSTALGILPGTFVYTLFADALLEGSTQASRAAFLRVAVAGVLLVFLSFLPTLLKRLPLNLPLGPGSADE